MCISASILYLSLAGANIAGASQDDRGTPPPAVFSAEQLRHEIATQQNRIEGFHVEYRSDSYTDEDARRAGAYAHAILAVQEPDRLLSLLAHGTREVSWELDPHLQRVIINGERALNINDVNRTYLEEELPAGEPLPGTLTEEFFFHATGLYPLTARPMPKRLDDGVSPSMLRDVAASEEFNVVRHDQELCNGRWCHVLERPGLDVLWIDVERGCALLAREACDRKSGALMWRFECSGHREVAPGVWLPTSLRNIQFNYLARTEELRQKRVLDSDSQVLFADVNRVDDKLFEFHPPAGALQVNPTLGKHVQTRPGGVDHLDQLVAWSKRVLSVRWRQNEPEPPWWRPSAHHIRWAMLGAVLGAFGIITFRRSGSRRSDLQTKLIGSRN